MAIEGQDGEGKLPQGRLALIAQRPNWSIGLVAASLIAWAFLAWIVVDMSHPFARLTMPASPDWSASNLFAIFAMWALMMAAMMLPSAMPMILTFVAMSRGSGDAARGHGFVVAYLAVWGAFSVAAAAAQWVLQRLGGVDPMLVSSSSALSAALLLIAGVYQFSPLKRLCLSRCQTPMGFLLGEWRPGARGAFVMGLRHGLHCLGCCWALMALLFVGGVMNLAWVAALSIAVALEKLLPRGARIAAALGIALLAVGGVKLLATSGWL
jgi:predicted metal-binding membrane protein